MRTKTSTRHFLRELNRFGLTSAIDAAGGFQNFPDNYGTVTELAKEGRLSLRIAYHLFPQTPGQELDDLARWIEMVRPEDGDEWLRLNGAGENLTWAAADFENFAEPRPELSGDYEAAFEKAVRLLMEHGWGFRLHATYDETIRRDLAVFEKLAAEGLFPSGNRWLFDHAETVSRDSLDRVAALGGAMSVQNRMSFQGEAFTRRYGPGAAAEAPPVRAMLERGLTVGAGTDATRVSTYNPWVALHWLVTGRTLGGPALRPPQNRVDRETALAMYTRAGAALTGEEDVKGVLRPGFFGDLAVLSHDYFAVPEQDIPHIESVLTVVGGRIVHAAAEYEGLDEELPSISPTWSPVAHFGGYQATPGQACRAFARRSRSARPSRSRSSTVSGGHIAASPRKPQARSSTPASPSELPGGARHFSRPSPGHPQGSVHRTVPAAARTAVRVTTHGKVLPSWSTSPRSPRAPALTCSPPTTARCCSWTTSRRCSSAPAAATAPRSSTRPWAWRRPPRSSMSPSF